MRFASLVVAILVVTLGISAFAQFGPGQGGPRGGRGLPPNGPPPPFPPQGGAPGIPPELLRAVAETLDLSPRQMDRIRGMLDTRGRSQQSAQDEIRAKLDALAALQGRPSPNAAELEEAMQALRQARQAQRTVNEKFRADFLGLLTGEQQKILHDLNAVAGSVVALSSLGILDNVPGIPSPPPAPQRGPGPGDPGPGGPGPGRRGGPVGPGPQGFMRAPESNPLTPEKVELGRRLFFDKRLSANGTLACVSCHDPERAFSDGRAVARGINGAEGERNAPALINAGFGRSFFWDGRTQTLEEQVLVPILNPQELGLTEKELERKTGLKTMEVTAALASYLRTIRSVESRFDWYSAGQTRVLNDLEEAGLELFRGRGQCIACHGGPNFTDDQFHNTGVAWGGGRFIDEGRFAVSKNDRDHGAFKTPTLREVARTAPYMHDGSLATLDEVVNFYSDGGRRNPNLDPRIRPLNLSPGEKLAILAFMRTLNGRIIDGL